MGKHIETCDIDDLFMRLFAFTFCFFFVLDALACNSRFTRGSRLQLCQFAYNFINSRVSLNLIDTLAMKGIFLETTCVVGSKFSNLARYNDLL